MKILYISYDGMTDVLGRSQVIPYLAGLSSKGYQIHLMSFEKSHITKDDKMEVDRLLQSCKITWHPLPFLTRPPGLAKLFDMYKIISHARKLHLKKGFDIVHCRSYIAALAGLHLKRKYRVKFVFDMRGFWVNERIEGKIWNMKNPVYRFFYVYFKKKEKLFFQYADAIVSLTYNGKGVIQDVFGDSIASKTHVIPCCTDISLFDRSAIDERQLNALRKEMGIEASSLVVTYLGSVGTWYMTDEMMVFFRLLKKKYPEAKFLFISGDDPDFLRRKAADFDIDMESILIVKAPREKVPLYLALSNISLFFIKPVFSKKASSPTKQAEILSMGIPLICNAGIGDTDLLMQDGIAGIMLENFSEEQMQQAVNSIESLKKLDPEKIRQKAISYFNLNDGIAIYDSIYKELQAL